MVEIAVPPMARARALLVSMATVASSRALGISMAFFATARVNVCGAMRSRVIG